MIRWFSLKRVIISLGIIFMLLILWELIQPAGSNLGGLHDPQNDLVQYDEETFELKTGSPAKKDGKNGLSPGVEETSLSKIPASLAISKRTAKAFELGQKELLEEFVRWDPKKESLKDMLWDRFEVVMLLGPRETEDSIARLDREGQKRVFLKSVLRHVSIFYGDYQRAGGEAPRAFGIPECSEIGLAGDDETSSKYLDGLAGSQGDIKFKKLKYYQGGQSGPFAVPEDNGEVVMVAKYFKIKEKKPKKGEREDSPATRRRKEKKNMEKSKQNFAREMGALSALQHPNIVHGICKVESRLEIVYPFLRGGDLVPLDEDVLGLRVGGAGGRTMRILNPDESFLPRFARQLVLAVNHMHKKDLVHFDLKPENLVVSGPNRQFQRRSKADLQAYHLILIDFGLCEVESKLSDECIKSGTEVTMAPEQIMCNHPVGFGTDWWGVAAALWRVRVFWEPSISEDRRAALLHAQDPQWGHQILPMQPFFSADFVKLMKLMLKPTPEDRAFDERIKELLDMPYLKV